MTMRLAFFLAIISGIHADAKHASPDSLAFLHADDNTAHHRMIHHSRENQVWRPDTLHMLLEGQCGDSSHFPSCPLGFYCHPWGRGFYQCLRSPEPGTVVKPDSEVDGDHLATLLGLTFSTCFQGCRSLEGSCRAITFTHTDAKKPTRCDLFSSAKPTLLFKQGALASILSTSVRHH